LADNPDIFDAIWEKTKAAIGITKAPEETETAEA